MNKSYTSPNKLLSISVSLVTESINLIHEIRKSPIQSKWKGKDDPLTIADIRSQTLLIKGLQYFYPEIKLVGEEDESDSSMNIDYSKINTNRFPNEVFSMKDEINIEDLTAFIDPLDGTLSFVNGDLNYVTVLLGFAIKGKPTIGIIGKIWENINETYVYQPTVYFGLMETQKVFYLKGSELDKDFAIPWEIRKPRIKNFKKDEFVVVYSKNKGTPELETNVLKLNPDRKFKLGATGMKFISIIKGDADCYFYDLGLNGTKRWDTCAGEALINCFSGFVTGKNGKSYNYEKGIDYQNENGLVVMMQEDKFHEVIEITKSLL